MRIEKNPVGRPKKINKTLINAICAAVESEMLPIKMIPVRFHVKRNAFRNWIFTGRVAMDKTDSDLSEYQRQCRELYKRLDALQKKHEQNLMERITEPEHNQTAKLVISLMPGWDFIESANSV